MKILLIHQNFPGQFKHLAVAMLKNGHDVTALCITNNYVKSHNELKIVKYTVTRGTSQHIHPWATEIETKIIRGEGCYLAAKKMKEEGYVPDVVLAHHGWGESMFIKDVWPKVPLGIYCEFFYHFSGADVAFDPEFKAYNPNPCKIRLKNINNLVHMYEADAGICPTHWQASTFPQPFRNKISVIHDGIDTDYLKPNNDIKMVINKSLSLTSDDEVVTFINRNLEPYRGCHSFFRSLKKILSTRKKCHVVIIGGNEVSYGAGPDPKIYGNRSWKDIFWDEIKESLSVQEKDRVHFVGKLQYEHYVMVMQLSSCHVYLTYPFVLSWSLLETMAIGAPVVVSRTQPLTELIDGNNGLYVDFFDYDNIADTVCEVLENKKLAKNLSEAGRETIVSRYDLNKTCLPAQMGWIEQLASITPSQHQF